MGKAIYNLYEAKTQLSRLVDRAAAGETIIIAKSGKPLATLSPLRDVPHEARVPGGWEGQVTISDDFDAPLPEELLFGFAGEDT